MVFGGVDLFKGVGFGFYKSDREKSRSCVYFEANKKARVQTKRLKNIREKRDQKSKSHNKKVADIFKKHP